MARVNPTLATPPQNTFNGPPVQPELPLIGPSRLNTGDLRHDFGASQGSDKGHPSNRHSLLPGIERVPLTGKDNAASTASWSNEAATLATIAGLLLLGTAIVYGTGGTGYAFPYVQLIPVLVAAARYQVAGGFVVAILGALLLGPFMPLDVAREIDQTTANWITRMLFFVLIGGLAGFLFTRIRQQSLERDRLARLDRPTGLPNRAALEEHLEGLLKQHYFPDKSRPALFIVRITDFFEALDAVGAEAGDELARATAGMIGSAGLGLGRPYRFSAAEIAFVAESLPSERISSAAAAIKAIGEHPVTVREVPVRVELCIGAERARSEDAGRPYKLIRRTHVALFAAQERNQDYAVYDPSYERSTRETFQLITRLPQALRDNQFELFYQPKIRLSDGLVTGVEGLIRWRDPEHGIIPPGQFMSKVELTSLISPVTRFVLHEACLFARDHPYLGVSINLSPRNLYDKELLDELCEMIERFESPMSHMEVEITEGTIAHDPDRAARRLQRLRDYGVKVSVDDFGTGYSSFAYLHRLPITGLKIDRSFLLELEQDSRVQGILRCITNAGHELGLEVTAEGVEEQSHLEILRSIGCDLAQGFHFTKPLPATDLEDWLSAYEKTERGDGKSPSERGA